MNADTQNDYDSGLDEVQPTSERLPTLEVGDYLLELEEIVQVDGDSGVYDIFQVTVLESRGEAANSQGSRAKISFKRDEKGKNKEIADTKLANCLQSLNGGEPPASNSGFIKGLRADPKGKFRVRVGTKVAVKSGNTYKTYSYTSI